MSKKKVLIYGSGLTSRIIKILLSEDQYELYETSPPKKNIQTVLHPHIFSSVFLRYLSKYVIKINIFKKIFREEIFSKLEKKLQNYKIKKIIFENFDFKFFENEIIFFNKKNKINKRFDYFIDCSGGCKIIKEKLQNKLITLYLSKSTTLISFYVKVLFNLFKSKIFRNNTFFLKNFHLTILNQKKDIYSFTFVSNKKIDKNLCERFLFKLLSKNKYEIIKSIKWFHSKSHFIYPKKDLKSYIPIGDAMMKTDPRHGLGATLGLLQCIFVSKNLDKQNFDDYFDKYKSFFNKIGKKKSKIFRRKKLKVLFRFMPFYNELRILYYLRNQKKLFSEVLELID